MGSGGGCNDWSCPVHCGTVSAEVVAWHPRLFVLLPYMICLATVGLYSHSLISLFGQYIIWEVNRFIKGWRSSHCLLLRACSATFVTNCLAILSWLFPYITRMIIWWKNGHSGKNATDQHNNHYDKKTNKQLIISIKCMKIGVPMSQHRPTTNSIEHEGQP